MPALPDAPNERLTDCRYAAARLAHHLAQPLPPAPPRPQAAA